MRAGGVIVDVYDRGYKLWSGTHGNAVKTILEEMAISSILFVEVHGISSGEPLHDC